MLALVVACDEGPDVVWVGEHVEIAAYPEHAERLCAGTGPYLDASAGAIGGRLGRSGRVTYYWVPGRTEEPCGPLAGGCAEQLVAFASAPLVEHELVHAYATLLGRPDPFIEEGLAEYLGGAEHTPAAGVASEFTGHKRRLHDPQFYSTAGRWVAEAVAQSSMDAVLDLYEASDTRDPPGRFEELVVEHLGVDMPSLEAAIAAGPSCSSAVYREDPAACAAPPMSWTGSAWVLERALDCDDPQTIGTLGTRTAIATFELREEEHVALDIDDADAVRITQCNPGCSGTAIVTDRRDTSYHDLPAGRYAVRAHRFSPGPVRVSVRP